MEWEHVIRCCHVCSYINEAEKEIQRCGRCGKTFSPVTSLEKIMLAAAQQDSSSAITTPFSLIKGLVVYW